MHTLLHHQAALASLLELQSLGTFTCTDTTMQCVIAHWAWRTHELEGFPMSRDLYPITCVLCGVEQSEPELLVGNVTVNEWSLSRWSSPREKELFRILRECIGGNGIAQVCVDCAAEENIQRHLWHKQDR